MNNLLETPIEYLKGVGPQRGELLRKELDIHRYGDLINLYPAVPLNSHVFGSTHREVIADHQGFGSMTTVKSLDTLDKVLTFLANLSLTFRVTEIRRIWRVDAPYMVSKKLILYFKPFFLLGEFIESPCDLLSC